MTTTHLPIIRQQLISEALELLRSRDVTQVLGSVLLNPSALQLGPHHLTGLSRDERLRARIWTRIGEALDQEPLSDPLSEEDLEHLSLAPDHYHWEPLSAALAQVSDELTGDPQWLTWRAELMIIGAAFEHPFRELDQAISTPVRGQNLSREDVLAALRRALIPV